MHVEILSFVPLNQLFGYATCSKLCKETARDDRLWYGKGIFVNHKDIAPHPRLCHSAVVSFTFHFSFILLITKRCIMERCTFMEEIQDWMEEQNLGMSRYDIVKVTFY